MVVGIFSVYLRFFNNFSIFYYDFFICDIYLYNIIHLHIPKIFLLNVVDSSTGYVMNF